MTCDSLRLFIAVDFPFFLKKELSKRIHFLASELKSWPLRWVNDTNLHITLKFLGETPSDKISEITSCLGKIVFQPLKIEIRQGGYFLDSHQRPKVLFFKIYSKELGQLALSIQDKLIPLGFSSDGIGYSPHLTLARVKGTLPFHKLKNYIQMTEKDSFEFETDSFILYQSLLRKEGSIYRKIEEFKAR